jgi:hypothetical protein
MSIELTAEQEKQVQARIQEQTGHIWEMVDCGMANVLKIMAAHYGEEAYQVYVKANS